MLRITCLMEDENSKNRSLVCEHGLSLLVECDGMQVLFDCGSGDKFLFNAKKLGLSLSFVDHVVLSHGHYDHASGFRDFLDQGNTCGILHIGTGFFEKKYSGDGFKHTDLSSGLDLSYLHRHNVSFSVVDDNEAVGSVMHLFSSFDHLFEVGTIPKRFEKRCAEGFISDDFHDEVAAAFETENGLVVVTGCSHSGILNIVSTISDRMGQGIYAVIGGLHLVESGEERIDNTISGLKSSGVEVLGLCHCTGAAAEERIRRSGLFECFHFSVGDVVEFK